MKIKTKNRSLLGNRLIVPVDGLVTIDGNGVVEVSEEAAESLLMSSDWEATEDNQNSKKDSDSNSNPNSNSDDDVDPKKEEKEIIAGIKAMELPQLIEMAEAAEYPKEEWEKHKENAKLLSGYLVGKFKASRK